MPFQALEESFILNAIEISQNEKMAFFSFGQTLKKKLSFSKRGSRNQQLGLKKSTLPPAEDSRVVENEYSTAILTENEGNDEQQIQWKLNSVQEKQTAVKNRFNEAKQYEERVKQTKPAYCHVASGPDVPIKIKDKSTQTKPDTRHKYVDTKDLLSFVQKESNYFEKYLHHTANKSTAQQVDKESSGTPNFSSVESDLPTKYWKDDWILSLSAKNHSRRRSEQSECHRNNSPTLEEEIKKSMALSVDGCHSGEFDVNFSLQTYPDLKNNRTMVKEILTRKMFDKLKCATSSENAIGIGKIIQQGLLNSADVRCIGAVACDEQSFECFESLFTPIIAKIHPKYVKGKSLPRLESDCLDQKFTAIGMVEDDFIFESRIIMKRSLLNFPFTPYCSKEERRILQAVLSEACHKIEGELSGKCWLLDRLTPEDKIKFKEEERKFKNKTSSDPWKSAGITRDWPDGRAIFKGGQQDRLTIFINCEEHLAMNLFVYDCDIKTALKQLLDVEVQIKTSIAKYGMKFAYSSELGNLNAFPSHLGLACCVASRVLFPSLDGTSAQQNILKKFNLKSSRGAVTKKQGYEISTFHQFGSTEVDLVDVMVKALNCMTDVEKRLQAGEDFEDILQRYDIV